jgi:hypothetical protein
MNYIDLVKRSFFEKGWKRLALVIICGAFFGMSSLALMEISTKPVIVLAEEMEMDDEMEWKEETDDVTIGNLVFRTRLSEDEKYAWIVKISQVEKKDFSSLEFPDEINGAAVIKLGKEPENEDDLTNIWGFYVEPYHNVDGYNKMPKGIKKLTLPSGLREICSAAFCGFREITAVEIPTQVEKIPYGTFYHCENLKEAVLPEHLQMIDMGAFEKCKSLTKITISKKNETYTCKNGVLYSKDKKALVWVATGRKKLTIPSGVTTIETSAVTNSRITAVSIPSSVTDIKKNALSGKKIETITVSAKNSRYKKSGDCIYDNKTKSAAVVLCKGGTVILPKEVKYLTNKVSTAGDSIKILYIPAGFKGFRKNSMRNGLRTVTGVRICMESKTPPKAVGKGCFAAFSTYYVPEESLEKYENWYMKAKHIGEMKDGYLNFAGY